MSSYNKLNGTYTSEEYDLLTTILRKEWGIQRSCYDRLVRGKRPRCQMKAGNDLLMPGTKDQSQKIIDAVKNGTLDEKVLDQNVERVLNLVLQSPSFKGYKYSDKPDLKRNAEISRTAAEEGMVLLRNNDNALPFSKSTHKVALFGIGGYQLIAGGTGSGDVNKAYTISLAQGLSNAGYEVNADIKNAYTSYLAEEKSEASEKKFF
jgi:beta-glucosidase